MIPQDENDIQAYFFSLGFCYRRIQEEKDIQEREVQPYSEYPIEERA